MIWTTLALFAISFLITALLAPKPKLEDARADELDAASFPIATEDAPIVLILGTIHFQAPNTLYSGGFFSAAITKRVRTGLFSRKTIKVGYNYYLNFQLGLCLGPKVNLRKIIIEDNEVFVVDHIERPSVKGFTGVIDKPNLFGGREKGGGFVCGFEFYDGNFGQPVSAYLESKIGVGLVPAYRGVSHIVFKDALIGESATLKKMSFVLECFPRVLGESVDPRIGDDINPAAAIVYIIRAGWAGLDQKASSIKLSSFVSAATTLSAEGNGVSIAVVNSKTGKEVVEEILRQIDGVLFEDPQTGEIELKLIRNDYGPPPLYDEDDILSITGFSKTSWTEVYSEVKVSFSKRFGEGGRVALAQDSAVINMLGRKKSSSISFPLCYDETTANKLASRELARLSHPIFRMTVEMNRNSYGVKPGDVISISYDKYGLSNILVRVQKYDLGALMENRIVLECIQDSFALDNVVFAPPVSSSWQREFSEPIDIIVDSMSELPYFYDKRMEYPSESGKTNILYLPRKPQTASTGYDLLMGEISGQLLFSDPEDAPYPNSFLLDAGLPSSEGFETGVLTSLIVKSFSGSQEIADFLVSDNRSGEGGVFYCNGEFFACEDVTDNLDGTYTLSQVKRALFGSTFETHAVDSVLYFIDIANLGDGDIGGVLSNTGTLYFKSLDKIGSVTQLEEDVTQSTFTAQGISAKPLRPRYVQINSIRTFQTLAVTTHSVSWRASNKESSQVAFETDAAETPSPTETYRVEVWLDGVENVGLRDTNATTPWTLNLTGLEDDAGEIRVYSESGSLSQNYAFLNFDLNVNKMLVSGDAQSGGDFLIPSGDAQTGTDKMKVSGT